MTRFRPISALQHLLCASAALAAAAAWPGAASAQTASGGDQDAPTTVRAEELTGRPDREVNARHDVEIVRGATTINADEGTYHIVEDEVDGSGNVRMRRYGDRYTGDEVKLNLESGQGYVLHPTYRLQKNNAHGSAERIDFASKEVADISDGTYSTCEGPDPDWYLKSDTMRLDQDRDLGTSRKTIVYFKGVPILGTPAMSFPLSDARKSGVLPPTFGTTSTGGFELMVPYYFNIAPNRDLTLYPKIIARRGLQLGATARYLGSNYSGTTTAETLPNDRVTNTTRYSISSTHTQVLAAGLGLNWNINTASDDKYPSDFASTLTASTQRLLLRDLNLTYGGAFWNATARVSNYQVLQDFVNGVATIPRPYDRLPQLTLNAARLDVNGFDWSIESDFTRFWHPDLVRGDRAYINPHISYPIMRPGYFLTPKLSFDATTYSLANSAPGNPSSLSRMVPTVSLDSGLVFERDTTFFGSPATQTLEPRLFYVNTPFRDQSRFPVFDTGLADLNFAQIFSENRYAGHDRIGDANQLTAALVTRYIEPSGAERMRLAIGQRFAFSEQQVLLPGEVTSSRSDLLLSATGRLSPTLSVDGNLQYSQTLRQSTRSNYAMRWEPAPKKVLNLQYRYNRQDPINPLSELKQVDVSGQWPIAQRWYGVGRINYSLPDKRVAEGLVGLEYKADCWIFRVVAQRIPTAIQTATSAFFIQLELNGLSKIGSNPLEAIRTNVPGYQMINQ
ncbi:MAG TPA: LPS-assembly protein LptD [Burkholderiaceae bacterium]|nr:LPS-assembly protein LptD [Burkholderiaceae bacterium]